MTSPNAAASTQGSSPMSATPSASSARADWLEISLLTTKAITAAAECVPFPYVKGVCGTAVALLETIEKVKKNREDWKELCETTMNIITIVHNQILLAATMEMNFHLVKALPIAPLSSNVWLYLQNLV
ncbi:hypothetical protein C8R44DRAFT_987817 [Mycena epipterygia]|nr:hypothetical protein C8R44DRAFT_987817 [Mycena epipterygia]